MIQTSQPDPPADSDNKRERSNYSGLGKGIIFVTLIAGIIIMGCLTSVAAEVAFDVGDYIATVVLGACGSIVRFLGNIRANEATNLHERGAWAAIIFQVLMGGLAGGLAYYGIAGRWFLQLILPDLPDQVAIAPGTVVLIGFIAGLIAPDRFEALLIDVPSKSSSVGQSKS